MATSQCLYKHLLANDFVAGPTHGLLSSNGLDVQFTTGPDKRLQYTMVLLSRQILRIRRTKRPGSNWPLCVVRPDVFKGQYNRKVY
jgi:hypothetical protein